MDYVNKRSNLLVNFLFGVQNLGGGGGDSMEGVWRRGVLRKWIRAPVVWIGFMYSAGLYVFSGRGRTRTASILSNTLNNHMNKH